MLKRFLKTAGIVISLALPAGATMAQDVPGIEICTVEKTMERRTSCLQSNVDFLKATMTKDALAEQAKRDAVAREAAALRAQVEALKQTVATLQKSVEQLQARGPTPADTKPKEPAK